MPDIQVLYTYRPASDFPTATRPSYHSHTMDEMLIVHAADLIAMTPNTYHAHKGPCIVFYRRTCPHAQINSSGTPYDRYCILFDRNAVMELLQDMSLFPSFYQEESFLIPLDEAQEARLTAVARVLYQCCQIYPDQDIRQKLLLSYLFAEVAQLTYKNDTVPPVHFYLTSVTQYIANHIHEKLTIDRISAEFHVSRAKLIRDFRDLFSMSISEYITMERLTRAKMMLQQGESVQSTAESCGFIDSAYFIRVFRKYYGVTPAVYRKQSSLSPELIEA